MLAVPPFCGWSVVIFVGAHAALTNASDVTITNEQISVTINHNGTLASVCSLAGPAKGVVIQNESFVVTVTGATLSVGTCPTAVDPTSSPSSVGFVHQCSSGFVVTTRFYLRTPVSRYVSKSVTVTAPATLKAPVIVQSVSPFGTAMGLTSTHSGGVVDGAVQANSFHSETDIAAFARFGVDGGAFVSITNPFFTATATQDGHGNASCTPGLNHVGDDLPGNPRPGVQTPSQCEAECAANPACAGYVWVLPGCEGTPSPGHCYLKRTLTPSKSEGCTCLARKPFSGGGSGHPALASSVNIGASYSPLVSLAAATDYEADVAVLGLTTIGTYRVGPAAAVFLTERQAFVDCVGEFLLDGPARQDRTVKVNVAWDENDYQIDVGTADGVTEYKRIIDRNADFGVTHIVYEPQNTLHASRFNSTDGWGWEAGLWFGMGELLREGKWDPVNDTVPDDILAMTRYADTKGIKLMAYVYPCLHFMALSKYFVGTGIDALDLGEKAVQDWMIQRMLAFMAKTGAGGWAWDHNIFTDGATPAQQYVQWRGWMRILAALRAEYPDMVMDHRQTAHIWGPWYQLAGSYLEPIAGDENPETYGVPIASLHTDHVGADNTRIINYKYSIGQLQPSSRIPGFIFHQTERTADNGTNPCFGSEKLCYDSNARDFDLLGYKYSLLSTVGTAGQNNVLTMIPARDPSEFQLFPAEDVAFIKGWLAWTDTNLPQLRMTRPIATLGAPTLGAIDGTCAVLNNAGFLFLFNPNMYGLNASLIVDESIGVTQPPPQSEWVVTEIYPRNGTVVARWVYNQSIIIPVGGSDARVLHIAIQSVQLSPHDGTSLVVDGLESAGAVFEASGARVSLLNVTGRTGSRVDAVVHSVPDGSTMVVNGVRCINAVNTVAPPGPARLVVDFGGAEISHAMPISETPVPPDFAGGNWQTTFTVPSAIGAQLSARRAHYPMPWDAADHKATWLVPERLLLNIFIEKPSDAMNVNLTIDGAVQTLVPAYNSRGLVRSKCFLGFYLDATKFTRDETTHKLELNLPKLAYPGQFQGCYWGNVETEYTRNVSACTVF